MPVIPVFLEKLTAFLRAFARRYDGDQAVAFVDVGSFGLYGEGHIGRTAKLSRDETERRAKLHMELYRKCLPNTYLDVSDARRAFPKSRCRSNAGKAVAIPWEA